MDTVLFIAFGALALIELSLTRFPLWRSVSVRRGTASAAAVTLASASISLCILQPSIPMVLVAFISAYRVVNLLRLIENRAHERHLRKTTTRTSLVLIGSQAMFLALHWYLETYYVSPYFWLYGLVAAQVLAAAGLFASTLRTHKKTQLYITGESLATSELPTVTVAIPARNETEALEDCLHALIASDYPKLEILVLDDCSQTKRTPEIIRSFAHDGVRFIKGTPPKENWLAKNQAYEKLSDEASGEIIIFCGVDVRFASGTIRQLVLELLGRQKRMMSVVPKRLHSNKPQAAFVQAARYLWELTPPRRFVNRPPVVSSCWMMYRKDLKKLGGFDAVSRMIIPEAHFAKRLLSNDGYSFVRASRELGLVSEKTHEAQRLTAIRTRYPQLRKRPENVMAVTLLELALLVGPAVVVSLGLAGFVSAPAALAAALSVALLIASHVIVMVGTGVQRWFIAIWSFLPVAITDLGLMHVSMQRYEFSEVIWKGRNVCIPVMHVTPSLPKV